MAATKISALPADDAVGGSEQIPVNDAGTNKRITPSQIISHLLNAAREFTGKLTLSGGYEEKGATLTPAAGTLTVPLDGGNYGAAITAATALATSNAPTAPVCSSSVVELAFAGATFGDLSFPATWYWGSEGIPTISETRVILTLATSVTGAIDAYATGRAQVA